MRTTVRTRFAPAASYTERRRSVPGVTGLRELHLALSGELHLRHRALRRVRELEVLLGCEAEHAAEQVRGEGHERGVVVAHVAVVEAARERDLVLCRGEVLGQVLELLDRLQLRVGLGNGAQVQERAAEGVLGLRSLLRRASGRSGDGLRARLRDGLEGAAL